jgi:spore coat polysaccharide biosynthesis protein SpsF
LPGKVLADVGGRPALLRLLERLKRASSLNGIIVATTVEKEDDDLVRVVEAAGFLCFRGSEEDVLARIVGAHRTMGTDLIVEITGDCILVDPDVVDLGVQTFLENDVDAVTNVVKPQFPQGVDVQVFPFDALAEVEATVTDPAVREHVSLYFYEHTTRYRILHLVAPKPYFSPNQRLQLDYPEDLKLIREVYRRLEPRYGTNFGTLEILQLFAAEPALADINRHCIEKPVR